jgi:hypothetical protein
MGALRHSYGRRVVKTSDWIWIADVDEFLNIHVGNGTIPDLIAACNNPVAISIPWQFMANSDIETYQDRPVIEQFLETHDPDMWSMNPNMEVKTLVRRDFPLDLPRVHRPFVIAGVNLDDVGRWSDASGRDVSRRFKLADGQTPIRALPSKGGRAFATLNHYALRSMESYLVKNRRGDVNREDRAFDTSYWQDRNDPARRDDSILRYSARLHVEMERLLTLEGVRAEHEASVAAHRSAIAAMRAEEQTADLLDQIRAAPKVSRAEEAFLQRLESAPAGPA